MDKTINDIATRYAQYIKDRYNPTRIYLYGSHARGTAAGDSDIDIAVVFDKTDNVKYWDIFGKLFAIAADVDSRIEPNLFINDGADDKYSLLHEIETSGTLIAARHNT